MQEFECSVCGERFNNEEDLYYHIKNEHPNEQGGDFECGVCYEKFGTKEELVAHIKSEHSS